MSLNETDSNEDNNCVTEQPGEINDRSRAGSKSLEDSGEFVETSTESGTDEKRTESEEVVENKGSSSATKFNKIARQRPTILKQYITSIAQKLYLCELDLCIN